MTAEQEHGTGMASDLRSDAEEHLGSNGMHIARAQRSIARDGVGLSMFNDKTAVHRDTLGRPTMPPHGLTLDMPHPGDLEHYDETSHIDMYC